MSDDKRRCDWCGGRDGVGTTLASGVAREDQIDLVGRTEWYCDRCTDMVACPLPPSAPALVVCCDGTWNRADAAAPTNVVRMERAAALAGNVVWYDPGVGTGTLDRIRGGVWGLGLEENVQEAYAWLADAWTGGGWPVFLFGFSRGAYTVRSLAGLMGRCGLPDEPTAANLDRAWKVYRSGRGRPPAHDPQSRVVDFLGVWDTVGALGIPGGIVARQRAFLDVTLGRNVLVARQALALDERRRPFSPALWRTQPVEGQSLLQTWFAGVHADVGGGRPQTGLSDIAFCWMWENARRAGLALCLGDADARPDPRIDAPAGDSMTLPYRLLVPRARRPFDGAPCEALHASALERLALDRHWAAAQGGWADAAIRGKDSIRIDRMGTTPFWSAAA